MTTKQIINFISSQDIFYYDPSYNKDNNRDPMIFEYIPITDVDKNYLENIKLIKERNLWNLFSGSDRKKKTISRSYNRSNKKSKRF